MTVSARPTVAVAAVVIDADDRVLLVRRARPPGAGLYTVPGGKVEAGERLADAVAREVAEETGLAVTVGPLLTVIERILPDPDGGPGWHYVILDYLATPRDPAAQPRAGDDVDDARFVARADLGTLPTTDGLTPVIDLAFGAAGR